MGVFNANIMETAPGACESNPWSPPSHWEGDDESYKALLRQRWNDIKWGQRILMSVSISTKSTMICRGPHARVAGDILGALMKQKGIQPRITFE